MVQAAAAMMTERQAEAPLFKRRRLTTAEFHRLVEAGILKEKDRVELVQGELVEMAPIGSRHSYVVDLFVNQLARTVPEHIRVRCQGPVWFDEHTELQPDVALLLNANYRDRVPGPKDVRLIIEVADSSLRYDRDFKVPLYARYGIPEVWLVDLGAANAVTVYREPGNETYRLTLRPDNGETLAPEGLPGVSVPLADLLA